MEGSCSIKATRKYKMARIFIYNFTLYSLTSLVTCFFFCYKISSLFPSMKNIIVFPLPSITISMDLFSLDAKCLFIVANIIIVVIVMQEYSKVGRSGPNSPPPSDIYDEYIARSRSSNTCPKELKHCAPDLVDRKEEGKSVENIVKSVCDEKRKKETMVQKKSEIVQRGKTNRVCNMPKEELNKRVEAFIARVNKQRLIEAKLVDQSRG